MAQVKVIEAWKTNFLRHIQQGRNVTAAARLSGVGLEKLYNNRRTDPEFAEAWDAKRIEAKERVNKVIKW